MLFLFHCLDKPDHLQTRLDNRDAHLAYVAGFVEQIVVAGPLLDDAEQMIGSLLIMDFPDRAAAEAFSANDPYRQAGLFSQVAITRWRKTLPA